MPSPPGVPATWMNWRPRLRPAIAPCWCSACSGRMWPRSAPPMPSTPTTAAACVPPWRPAWRSSPWGRGWKRTKFAWSGRCRWCARDPGPWRRRCSARYGPGVLRDGPPPLGGSLVPLHPFRHVPRHGHGTQHGAGAIRDQGKAHFDVELAARFVHRAGDCRAPVQARRTVLYGGVEAAPMGGAQVLGNDEVEALAEGLGGGVAEQGGGGLVPPRDDALPVRVDEGVSRLVEDQFAQGGQCLSIFHAYLQYAVDCCLTTPRGAQQWPVQS